MLRTLGIADVEKVDPAARLRAASSPVAADRNDVFAYGRDVVLVASTGEVADKFRLGPSHVEDADSPADDGSALREEDPIPSERDIGAAAVVDMFEDLHVATLTPCLERLRGSRNQREDEHRYEIDPAASRKRNHGIEIRRASAVPCLAPMPYAVRG